VELSKLKAVELFAGIGGFRLAADSFRVETVWANDIDAKACLIYRQRFGKGKIQEGDIANFVADVPKHQLLTGGFPCQPFSSAGKKEGIRDPRGSLFHHIVTILRQHHPACFVLENVKRLLTMEDGCHFATILSALAELEYQIEWRVLNAMHVGLPQNRQRIIILGLRRNVTTGGQFDFNQVRLAQPRDFSAIPSRLLETVLLEDKWRPITKHGKSFPCWGLANNGKFVGVELKEFSAPLPQTLLRDVLESDPAPAFDFTASTLERLTANTEVKRFVGGVEILSNQGGGARMGYTIFGTNGVAPTLTAATSRHYERYSINGRYRRLTNIEYARIQGFPDDHCREVSVYDQYALYGNAVSPPLVKWVFSRLNNQGQVPPLPHETQFEFA
jgi:DNA (cytosine-5)-methyltransferase 1